MVAHVSFTPPLSPAMPTSIGLPPASGSDAFSKMLNQRRAEADKPRDPPAEKVADKPAEKPAEKTAEKATEKSAEPSAEKPSSKLAEKPGKKAAEPATARAEASVVLADAAGGGPRVAAALGPVEAADTHDAPAMDPSLSDWMAGLHLPPPPAPPVPDTATLAGGGTAADVAALMAQAANADPAGRPDTAASADAAPPSTLPQAARLGDLGGAVPAERAGPSPIAARGEAWVAAVSHDIASDFNSELTRAEASTEFGKGAGEAPAVGAWAHAAHASPLAAPERSGHTAPTGIALPTPVNSPEFPQALGVQLSVLAKQGIQQAELQLNPPEMGPIAVQIALDGNKAQVDFTAATAATRQILENGLPELASALREAGLTLTGGGVFQQSRQSRQGEDGAREGGGRSDGALGRIDEPAATPRRQVRVANGGVDLYA